MQSVPAIPAGLAIGFDRAGAAAAGAEMLVLATLAGRAGTAATDLVSRAEYDKFSVWV